MAKRILVQCKTREMPGSSNEQIKLMAEAACQKVWNRSFDDNPDGDRLSTFGGYFNPSCTLLIDHGPVEAEEFTLVHLTWAKDKLYVLSTVTFTLLILR